MTDSAPVEAPSPEARPGRETFRRPFPLKLAAFYFIPALGFLLASFVLPPWLGWLSAWHGLSLAGMSGVVVTGRASLLGKRADGSLRLGSVLFFLPYFLFLWVWFELKRRGLRDEASSHELAPGLFIGRRSELSELPEACSVVVDLTSEFREPKEVVESKRYRLLPTVNRLNSEPVAFLSLLDELESEEGVVFVHCGAGRGRAAMFTAALMVRRGWAADAAEAMSLIRRKRPGCHLHPVQAALVDWASANGTR